MAGWFRCFGSSDRESSIDGTVRQSRGGGASAKVFRFQELASATNNFAPENLLGEGGFGRVFKGQLKSTGQVVAVKQLDWGSHQGNREFLVEVLMLSHLEHPNLVNLVGYCSQENHRLVVYEFMPLGSLEGHLHDITPDREPLDWNTRMKIAAGAAAGLEYLHKSHPPVIHRDMKASNILLDEGHNPKLSDFGLAKLGPVGDETHVSTQVMGTYGYCAPEYAMTGQLTLRSDVYSYGVVLLELISGRKAFDNTLAQGEQSLVAWARPLFRNRTQFRRIADPLLQGHYPQRSLYQSLAVAAMCLQEDSSSRPTMKDIVSALAYLASQPYDPNAVPTEAPRLNPSTTNQSSPGGRPDNQDEVRFGGQHTSQSPNRDSPNITEGDAARYGTEGGRGEPAGGLGRNSNVGELDGQAPQRNSPARPRNDSTEGDTAGGPGRNSNGDELDGQAPQRNSPARPRNEGGTDSTDGNV